MIMFFAGETSSIVSQPSSARSFEREQQHLQPQSPPSTPRELDYQVFITYHFFLPLIFSKLSTLHLGHYSSTAPRQFHFHGRTLESAVDRDRHQPPLRPQLSRGGVHTRNEALASDQRHLCGARQRYAGKLSISSLLPVIKGPCIF